MPSNDSDTPRSSREAARVGWIVLFALVALIPLTVWKNVREPDTPEEVVTAFFEAISDKDIETALSYVRSGIPIGEAAAFVHPDAIGDWELLEVDESAVVQSYSSDTDVKVTLGNGEGTVEGRVTVVDFDDELTIEDPFIQVQFLTSPQLEVQVGDRVVERDGDAFGAPVSYSLLPGVYRFYGGEPVAVLGSNVDSAIEIAAPQPEPTPEQFEALQSEVVALIDACVEYRTPAPSGCPFSTDGRVDTLERERMENIEDLTWTVSEYPEATLRPGTDNYEQPSLILEFSEPGRLELTGIGTPDYDRWLPFEAACHFGGSTIQVLLVGDDAVDLRYLGDAYWDSEADTCRGTE